MPRRTARLVAFLLLFTSACGKNTTKAAMSASTRMALACMLVPLYACGRSESPPTPPAEPTKVVESVTVAVQKESAVYEETALPNGARLRLGSTCFRDDRELFGVDWSPDGKSLATVNCEGVVRLWNLAGRETRIFGKKEHVGMAISWSPNGKMLASAGGHDHAVRVWDPATGNELLSFRGHSDYVNSVSWSPDGTMLASGSQDKKIFLWNVSTGKESRSIHVDSVRGIRVRWSPDGKILASTGNRNVHLWNPATGKKIRTLTPSTQDGVNQFSADCLDWSPDSKSLASGGSDSTIRIWDCKSGQQIRSMSGHRDDVYGLSWSKDGNTLASASADKTIRLWNVASGKVLHVLEGHMDTVTRVCWSPDGQTLASIGYDRTVRLWDPVLGKEIHPSSGHGAGVSSVSWSPDGTMIATGSGDKTVRLWSTTSGKELRVLTGAEEFVSAVAWAPDGKSLAAASGGKTVRLRLWDPNTGKTLRTLEGHDKQIASLSWSRDGRFLASASHDGTVRLWGSAEGDMPRILKHQKEVHGLAWAPDGTTLATACNDGMIRVWDTTTVKVMKEIRSPATALVWSPDGSILGSAETWNMRLYKAKTGELVRTLTRPDCLILGASWSPDGKRLALECSERNPRSARIIRLWDLTTGNELCDFETRENMNVYFRGIAFSPDGASLASSCLGTHVLIWDMVKLPEKSADPTVVTNAIGMKLKLIPAGKFKMGTPNVDEFLFRGEIQHEVEITKPFYMGVFEVTQEEYEKVMGKNPSVFKHKRNPAETVSWQDAADFCRKLSDLPEEKAAHRTYRLPTEAQWEYACRAGTTTEYHCGNKLTKADAHFDTIKTAPVGSYPPNAFGLYDMHGNVSEWCSDWYDYDQDFYKKSPRRDPENTKEGNARVMRGGNWINHYEKKCRSAERKPESPEIRHESNGFRVVAVKSGQ